MAFSAKAGTISSPTSTGAQGYTGVGFQPKVVIFIFEENTADGSGVNVSRGIGFAISSSSRASVATSYLDAVSGGTINMNRGHSNAHCIYYYKNNGGSDTAFLVADLDSMDSDGFTLDWTTVQASAYKISYIALGGTDLTNVAIKQLQSPASTGSVGYTGVGFQPDSAISISTGSATTPPAVNNNSGSRQGISFINSSAQKGLGVDWSDVSFTKRQGIVQKTNAHVSANADSSPTIYNEASFTSFDSDGFTLNWTTITASNRYAYVLCLKGLQSKVGVFNQNTTGTGTGNQSITGVGFQPAVTMYFSANRASSTSVQTPAQYTFGGATSSSARFSLWSGGSGTSTSVADHNTDNANVLKMMTEGTPTTNTVADFVSHDSDGFTINNTTVDGTAREVVYMALAGTSVSTILKDMIGTGFIPFAR